MTRVLVNPLDWGLGHATRCVPLVHELLRQGCEVFLGSTGLQRAFFSSEFPSLTQIEAPSYQIHYPAQGWQMPFWLMSQLPRLRKLQNTEHLWTEKICREYDIQWVISDNRFGCYSHRVYSTYLTHQNHIVFPSPFRRLEICGETWHRRQQRHFQEVWIPDFCGEGNLAGILSQAGLTPGFHHHIGPLTRFAPATPAERLQAPTLSLLVMLSGPEPQRTLFEHSVLRILSTWQSPCALLQGKPGQAVPTQVPAQVQIYSHLPTPELRKLILQSSFVLCRSGYSTLMDLQALGSKAILVPTPGQTEQELLGRHLQADKQCGLVWQNELSVEALKRAMSQSQGFKAPASATNLLSSAISQTLHNIQSTIG